MENVKTIIETWLVANGYDALLNPDCSCGCSVEDIAPCGALEACVPAVWIDCLACDESERCKLSPEDAIGAALPGYCKMAELKDAPDGQPFRRVLSNGGRGWSFVPAAGSICERPCGAAR